MNLLLYQGEHAMALAVAVTFDAYFRPSETLSLEWWQVLAPIGKSSGALSVWSILLRAQELQTASKTGLYDVSIVLDNEQRPWLGPALARMRQTTAAWASTSSSLLSTASPVCAFAVGAVRSRTAARC